MLAITKDKVAIVLLRYLFKEDHIPEVLRLYNVIVKDELQYHRHHDWPVPHIL